MVVTEAVETGEEMSANGAGPAEAQAGTQLDGIRQKVFLDRYAFKDRDGQPLETTPEQMWRRVAQGIAAVEPTEEKRAEWADKFYEALSGFKFVPGGRILAGAGTGHQVTYYNCYVIPSPDDSRHGILDNLKVMVDIMARGGGVGINLSSLRPRGSYITTVNGTSSGPCSWAQLYSVATTDVIQQGGSRRGALMLMLNDDHPDIEEFVTVKQDLSRINGANLSVCVSDPFMEAVKNDDAWDLTWQGEVKKTLKARELWSLICEAAWASGEPGMVFIDRYNKQTNTWYYEEIICVNPCVTGDTLIYTEDGLLSARELAESGQAARIISPGDKGIAIRQASHVFCTGIKSVFRLQTKEGYGVRLTADHRVLTEDGWKEARALVKDDRIRLLNGIGGFGTTGSLGLGRVLGWLVGDGYINHSKQAVVLSFFGEEKRELALLFRDAVADLVAPVSARARAYSISAQEIPERDEARIESVRLLRLIDPVLLADKRQVPSSVERGSQEMQLGFLQALLTADGSVQGTQEKGVSVRLSSNSASLLEGVQRLLLNFGIASRIYLNRRSQMIRTLPDSNREPADYVCQANHELVVTKANVPVFAKRIGFLTTRKQQMLEAHLVGRARGFYREHFLATFESLEPDGEEEVYDLTEPEAHLFVANGLVVHNCGEQGLPAWGVCNLGALNLAAFVHEGEMDYEALAEHARVAIRFLDNVVAANEYFIKENAEAQLGTRRTGLGTMGLGDALIKMRLPYGSDDSLPVIERIYRTIRDAAYESSAEIAAEKGPFPQFDRDKYLQGPFIQELPQPVREKIAQHGTRNAVLLTQAPTGTTSLLSGVSSGIEPVYDFAFVRRDRIGEHVIYHPLLQEWKDKHADPSAEVPAWFVSANDLTPEEHVRVQAVVQQFTDASISKTVNAPNSHTVEDVKRLYTLAYDLGLKGITYFRDGCREGVLSHIEEAPAAAAAEAAPVAEEPEAPADAAAVQLGLAGVAPPQQVKPRPATMHGLTFRKPTPLGTAFVTVNYNGDEQPFEVFTQVGKAGSDTAADAEAMSRLISLILRLPSPLSPTERLQQVVDQLDGIGGGRAMGFGPERVRSLPDGIAQVLTDWLVAHPSGEGPADPEAPPSDPPATGRAGTTSTNGLGFTRPGDLCPQCGHASLVREEGCQKCYSCGYSEC